MKLSRSLYTSSGNSDRCVVRDLGLSESTLTVSNGEGQKKSLSY